MKKQEIAFLIVIFLVAITHLSWTLDQALIGRYVVLCAGLVILLLTGGRKLVLEDSVTLKLIIFSYLGYALICICSSLWAINPFESLFEGSKVFLGFIIFIMVIRLNRNSNFLPLLVKVSVLVFLVYAVIVAIEIMQLEGLTRNDIYTINGINGHKNQLSNFLYLLLPFQVIGSLRVSGIWKKLSIVTATLNVLLILFLQTRSTWVALVVFLGTIFLIDISSIFNYVRRSRIVVGVLVLLLTAFLITVFSTGVIGYLKTSMLYSASIEERKDLWDNTLGIIRDNPIIGVGSGNWETHFANYGLDDFDQQTQAGYRIPQRPHNDYLWILSETGIMGFLFYAVVISMAIRKSARQIRIKHSLEVSFLFAAFLGYLALSFFTFSRERVEHIVFVNVILGILVSFESNKPGVTIRINKLFSALMLAVLFFLVTLGLYRIRGEYYMMKVIQYRQLGDPKRVEYFTNRVTSVFYMQDNFGMPISWYRGVALVEQGLNNEAFPNFQMAMTIAPYNVHVLNNLASSNELKGYHEEAKNIYKEAVRISPGFDDARLNLAAILYNEGNYKEALYWVEQTRGESERKNRYLQVIKERLN